MASQDHGYIRVLGASRLENRWMYMSVWVMIFVNLLGGLIQTYLGAMLFSYSEIPQAIKIGEAMALGTVSRRSHEKEKTTDLLPVQYCHNSSHLPCSFELQIPILWRTAPLRRFVASSIFSSCQHVYPLDLGARCAVR